MSLTKADRHFWEPIPAVVQYVTGLVKEGASVLEIGPGNCPFPLADTFIDANAERLPKGKPAFHTYVRDLNHDLLPFSAGRFDFVYARHVLEDMHNPFPLCSEMMRVARAGYIETPSPIAEISRGVDGGAPSWRGYHHHHWMIWAYGNELRFISKFPIVEHQGYDESDLAFLLKSGARYWNTYFAWKGDFHVKHFRLGADYVMDGHGYQNMVEVACNQSKLSTDAFWLAIPSTETVPVMLKQYVGADIRGV